MSNRISVVCKALALFAVACAQADVEAPKVSRPADDTHELDHPRLQNLARDYVGKVVDEAESLQIRSEIRALDPREARFFHEHLGQLNGYRGTDKMVFDLMFEEAVRQQKSFLDLDEADFHTVFERIKASPADFRRED